MLSSVNAQLKPVYAFWKDDSLVKKDLFTQAQKNQDVLLDGLDKQYKDDYKMFYKYRFQGVRSLLKSDRSVTAAEPHQYLQSLLQKIVDVNPELKPLQIRMVFSRDWWPNASSMGDGTLVVNAGLMVFLTNEAELVFVLCHELAHLYLDHSGKSIKKTVEKINSEDFKKEMKRLAKEEFRVNQQYEDYMKSLVFDTRKHSREHEAEADHQAYLFMKKTGFDCNGIKTCLALLDRVDDSMIYKPLMLEEVLTFPDYAFKKKWIQKESVLFGQMKEDDMSPLTQKEKDSLKTHPDCEKRIALLEDSIKKAGRGKAFLVNEELFNKLKEESFPEFSEEQYREEDMGRNLYYSLLMLQAGANTPLAIYSIARDLNLAYESQKEHKLGRLYHNETRGYADDYNLFLRMLSRLKLDEIGALAHHFCKKYQAEMAGYAGFAEQCAKATSRGY